MRIERFPFHLGPMSSRDNPVGFPNTLPLECIYDEGSGLLIQRTTQELVRTLDLAYKQGIFIGTPLADEGAGRPYADDFLSFVTSRVTSPGRALEIGAGTGYLVHRLGLLGWSAIGIEPGRGYEHCWERFDVRIIQDTFPSVDVAGPFDLIYSYAVIEHLNDPVRMLGQMRRLLSSTGKLVLAVPDCSEEVKDGDPSILLHEHLTYFTRNSLTSLLNRSGFEAAVEPSLYGRSLYAVANPTTTYSHPSEASRLSIERSYPSRAAASVTRIRKHILQRASRGTLGFFVPGRGLAYLDPCLDFRFFDDDPALLGSYIPPFRSAIESREALLASPVDDLVILSRTFGTAIEESLRQAGYEGAISQLSDLDSGGFAT